MYWERGRKGEGEVVGVGSFPPSLATREGEGTLHGGRVGDYIEGVILCVSATHRLNLREEGLFGGLLGWR